MVNRFEATRAAALVALSALVFGIAGCECDPAPTASITITSPVDGAMLTLASDQNDALSGVQITVQADVIGLAAGDQLDMQVDSTTVATAIVPSAGPVEWADVTIPSGSHTLVAVTREGGLSSNVVRVTMDDACFQVTVVTPAASGDRVTLGPEDDTDGMACGGTFETEVVASTAAPAGSSARVFVNGTPRRTATVEAGGVVRFDGVGLDNRGDSPNTLRVEVTDLGELTCTGELAVPIYVDCMGASCAITQPDSGTAYLNSNDDTSADDGFQGDFAVTTDADGADNQVRLIIDGNETDALVGTASGTVASFDAVDLSEGVHRVVAECTDGAGNTTRSGAAEWTVDTIACDVALTDPVADQLFIDSDDLSPPPDGTPGIQVLTAGTAGADCTGIRVAPCGSVGAMTFAAVDENWTGTVTLDSTAMQDLCAETTDEAGNVGRDTVSVRLRTDAPQLEFVSPNTTFNSAGTVGLTPGETLARTADLVAGNAGCEADFEVYCTDVDSAVELRESGVVALLASANCDADASAPAPYMGRATFSSASIPSRNNGTSYALAASQTVDRITGSSEITILADCSPPQLDLTDPLCGATLQPDSDDSDLITDGFQYNTVVGNLTDRGRPVRLVIRPTGGGASTYDNTVTIMAGLVEFTNAHYGAGGSLDLIATATDIGGNDGTNGSCSVTVEDIPTLMVTAPTPGAVLSMPNDCDTVTPGFQLGILGTTDADDGSTVDIVIEGTSYSTTVMTGGVIDACLDAPDGRMIDVGVTVTDALRGTASASLIVTIDTMPPTMPITGLTATVSAANRRAGVASFSWTPVMDAGGVPLSAYHLRCAAVPIADPASPPTSIDWADAEVFSITTVPGMGSTADVAGFRPGETRNCVLRGSDPTGAMTPLSNNATVTVDFLTHVVTAGSLGGMGLGRSVASVGDVNGDSFDDVLVGGDGSAYLYYGNSGGTLNANPAVRFRSSTASAPIPNLPSFGSTVAAIGDLNGDGVAELAIADGSRCNDTCDPLFTAGLDGAVYIIFGRTTDFPMADCDLATTCAPNITLLSDDGVSGSGFDEVALLGEEVSSAGDFDGDGTEDILISAPWANGFTGRAYLVSGASLSTGMTYSLPGDLVEIDGFIIESPGGGFAETIASAGGNIAGDSRDDLLIGQVGGGGEAAHVILGTPLTLGAGGGVHPLPSTSIVTFDTGSAGRFALQVAAAGDVNADRRLDALIQDNAEGSQGSAYLYLGSASGFGMRGSPSTPPGSVFLYSNAIGANRSADRFGSFIAEPRHPFLGSFGDIDGDGRAETLIGSEQTFTEAGTATLYYNYPAPANRTRAEGIAIQGSTDALTGSSPFNANPAVPNFIGDVNADGFPDIGVGAPVDASGAGRFVVIY